MSDVRKCDICGRTHLDPDDPGWGVLLMQCTEWDEFDVCPACVSVLRRVPTYVSETPCNKLDSQMGDGK